MQALLWSLDSILKVMWKTQSVKKKGDIRFASHKDRLNQRVIEIKEIVCRIFRNLKTWEKKRKRKKEMERGKKERSPVSQVKVDIKTRKTRF